MNYIAFDYDAPAEMYMPKHKSIGRRPATGYRRFSTAAEAIRFAIEKLPAINRPGAWMQVGDQRYNSEEMRQFYESSEYPLRSAPT